MKTRPSFRHTAGRLLLEKAPLFLLSAVASIVAFVAQARSQAVTSLDHLGFLDRITNALASYLIYLGKTIWPRALAIFYPYIPGQFDRISLVAVLLLSSVTALAMIVRHRHPYLICGWLWYLGTLAPVIGIVQLGLQARADRYTYIPLIGIFIVIAWGGKELLARRRALIPATITVALFAITAFAAQARVQVGYWRDNLSLFQHNLEATPDDAMSLKNLGIALSALGRTTEANRYLSRAYKLSPTLRARSFFNTGRAMERAGNHNEAVRFLRESVRINPGFSEARQMLDRILRDHPETAAASNASGQEDGSAMGVNGSRSSAPSAGDAHSGIQSPLARGDALARLGKFDEAIAAYQAALRIQPDFAGAYNNIGCAFAALGRFAEAEAAFREAIRLQPDYVDAQRNLARALADKRSAGQMPGATRRR